MIYNVSDNEELREKQLKEWINTRSKEGDTALNFTSFFGNFELLDHMVNVL